MKNEAVLVLTLHTASRRRHGSLAHLPQLRAALKSYSAWVASKRLAGGGATAQGQRARQQADLEA